MKRPTRVLIVDDETFVRDSLTEVLRHGGFAVSSSKSVDEASARLAEEDVDVVVTDLRMPKKDGLELLRSARRAGVAIPVLMITGVGTVSDAVEAMKSGAFDFLQKPVEPAALVRAVERAAEHHRLASEVRSLRGRLGRFEADGRLVGDSGALDRARAMIAQVAPSDANVLVRGESGTGKALAARAVHRSSARAPGPLVLVNCAALAASEFEAELFGCRASAGAEREGRIAEAEGGTLVLDEIGALEPRLQAKLLRFLETREVQPLGATRPAIADVRVIAITNEDLEARVKDGSFRADLYHRLAVFPLHMPALREHKEDLPAIAEHLMERARQRSPFGAAGARVDPAAFEVLARYDWPGNVRELANLLERAQILAPGRVLAAELFESLLELPLSTAAFPAAHASSSSPASPLAGGTEFHLRRNLDALEKEIVQRALVHSGGKKKEAALLLGIDPRNLGYYLRKHKLAE